MSQSANNKSISATRLTAISQTSINGIPDPAPLQFHTSARDAAGRFYLSDEFNHRVIVLDSDGKCLNVIGSRGGGPGQFWYPRGLAIVNEGGSARLVVCDAWNHRIQVFDAEGAHLRSFGSIGEGDAHFNEPCVVLPEDGGNVWILDRCNHRIKICSLDGRTLKIIGRRMTVKDEERLNDPVSTFLPMKVKPSTVRGLFYPMSMARLDGGDFIVADTNNGRLVRMRPDGVVSQILNLKGDIPPYLFPAWVGNAGGGFVALRGFSGPFRTMNLARPWIDAPIDLGDDALIAVSLEEADVITVIDAQKGRISRHSLDKHVGAETPPPFTMDSSTVNVSRSWSDRNGQSWLSYLSSAPEPDTTGELAWRFAAMCRNEAVKAGNKLSETESAYLRSAVEYHALAGRVKHERREAGAPSAEVMSAFNWQMVSVKQIEAERNELRRILIQNLSLALGLIGAKSGDFVDKYLAAEADALRKILEDELKARVEDYRRVEQWLMESVDKPTPPNPTALLNGVIGILFLYEHARYLKRVLKALGSDAWKEAPECLPWAVSVWRGVDISVLVNHLYSARGYLLRQTGRHSAAIETFKNGVTQDIQNKISHEIQIGATMLLGGDVNGAISHFRSMAAATSDPRILMLIGKAITEYGRDAEALEVFRKALENLKPDDPLYMTVRQSQIHALKNIGAIDEALKMIGEMEKASPSSPDSHIWRAETLLMAMKYTEALASLRKAREHGAGAGVVLRMANIHRLIGESGEAVKLCESVSTHRDFFEQARMGLARSLMMKGSAEEALETLDSMEFVAAYSQATSLRLEILRTMGRIDESTSGYERLVEMYPETRGLRDELGLSLALSGDTEGALAQIEIEERRFPGHRALRFKGMVLRICGRAMESSLALADERHVSMFSPLISMERLISARLAGDEKESAAAMGALKEIAGRAEAWNGLIFAREEQGGAIEKTFTFAEEGLRGASKVLRYERRSPITWWYAVK